MKRVVEQTKDGSPTLFVPELNEHYHSVKGARTESEHIFVNMGLKASRSSCPNVLEMGFGTGLNALLSLEYAEQQSRKVKYTGIELYPLAWGEISPLNYSNNQLFKEIHNAPWDVETDITTYFSLKKIQADANQLFGVETVAFSSKFDVVYFDAFAPEKQPEMWSEELLRSIYINMETEGILTTYCAKGVIRRMLQDIGFKTERLPGPPGGKREILRAIKI
jgi:tRNA U34 5-methylaminomethyl-2-thiouridine-forming methyltransferase MnmC